MNEPEIKYPSFWTYAIVGEDEEELRLLIGEIVKGTRHQVKFSKLSTQRKYSSIHVDIEVSSKEERDRFFQAFQSDPRVKFII